MSALRVLLFVLAGSLLAACHVGPQIDESQIGRQPQGANVMVKLKSTADVKRSGRQGELLEVREDGLVIVSRSGSQSDAGIELIPWGIVLRVDSTNLKGFSVRPSQRGATREAAIDKLRIVSRFPQGLSPELTEQLLMHYGQQALNTVD